MKNFLTKREFWPDWLFYIPLYLWYGFRAIQMRSWGRIISTNPGLTNAGFIDDGKRESLKQIDNIHIPKTIFWSDETINQVSQIIDDKGINLPFIAKADIGSRSQQVKIIKNKSELSEVKSSRGNIIIQEYICNHEEFGITYYRLPGSSKGKILGLMYRSFLDIIGNGKSTLEQMINNDDRYYRYADIIQKENIYIRNDIIPLGKKIRAMPFGAHSKGTIFYDYSDKIDNNLTQIIDQISQKINGFYIGRFDIKAKSLEDLNNGSFKILELNGIGGIPAHMYDPKYNIFDGRKILFEYWGIAYNIAKQNQKNNPKIITPNMKQMFNLLRK